MLLSLALIIVCGLGLGGLAGKLKLPPLVGMLATGIILGPFALNLIAPEVVAISADIRQIALIILLLRAGLSLDIVELKKVGRPAILMCFLPGIFEIAGTVIFAPLLFGISYLEAAIMGCVLAAVSEAIIVPRMLKLFANGYGSGKNIPQLILAGASVDDTIAVVLFAAFMSTYQTGTFDALTLLSIPISIITGIILGVGVGILFVLFCKKIKMKNTVKGLFLLSLALLFVVIERLLDEYAPSYLSVSSLLAVMMMGCVILQINPIQAEELSKKYHSVWTFAEIMLFVLVGSIVDINLAVSEFGLAIALLFIILSFRVVAVWICLIKTPLNKKEKLFCSISYLPKATVQASISAMPLAAGIPAGALILIVALISILITAPLGAFGIDLSYKRLLSKPLTPIDTTQNIQPQAKVSENNIVPESTS